MCFCCVHHTMSSHPRSRIVTKSLAVKFAIFLLVCLFGSYKLSLWLWDSYKLQRLESSWNGFGQEEQGYYDFTVVTGLFDIGRGGWWTFQRTYREYLGYLMQILMLDVNVVVFIEPKGKEFVERIRKGRESRTLIVPMQLSDLEYYPLLPRMQEIMASSSFQVNNTNYEMGVPEGINPLYNLVTNSKVSLMHRAISTGRFKTDHYVWLDGGYGHGEKTLYPSDRIWHPRHLLTDKVSFISFESLTNREQELKTLYKNHTAWIAGGLFAGSRKAMHRFYLLHKQVMGEYMERGVIDDDQTTFVECVLRDEDNFCPVPGKWYDLLRPFR